MDDPKAPAPASAEAPSAALKDAAVQSQEAMVEALLHPRKPVILLADGEIAFRKMTQQILEKEGYEVETAVDGDDALARIKARTPDIALLDVQMMGKGGMEVCRLLRRNPITASLPVIIMTRSPDRAAKLESLQLGADDYLNKLGELEEIKARISMIIKRNKLILDSNALTHLPGNRTIQARIMEAIEKSLPIAVMYFDLNNFKSYNDAYGYEAGDRVIHATAELLAELVMERDGENDFLGHIGGDDFIYVTSPDRAEVLAPRIVEEFETLAPTFYNEQDRKNGYIVSTDRQGAVKKFGFVGVAIGIAHNRSVKFESFGHVAKIGAELKHYAKQNERSSFVMDRRKA